VAVMKSCVACALAALGGIAAAQPLMPGAEPPLASAFGPDPIIQIRTTFRARIEGVADVREVPSATAQDSARRALYTMAANECTVLAEYWKAECRLNSFAVYVPLRSAEAVEREAPSMFGTAVYELRLVSPAR